MEHASLVVDWRERCESTRTQIEDRGLRRLIGYQLRRAEMAMQQRFSLAIGVPFQLRQVEFFALSLLAENPAVTHKQISEALAIAPSNMVGIMSGLKARDLVARRANPADGRSLFWVLTEAGRDLVQRAGAAVARMEEDALGRAEPERDELVRALNEVWAGDPLRPAYVRDMSAG
ncbi:MarR family winged helix-turn-helix transcriptional regulator [Salinisphaera sp.]|uniref:MarR family winged helix-turn-helix transcriptional regulator n=1 Tax=Salinisphaera sp. TaxID=1914330 RepID=UPI002D78334C|nr:MarR family winged helix-turn-helix transcriptional regulator [Salinisphaera sp.]HET7313399.1 MarR family winged helix-turn-helix transcriptional regulator [Salinisphaera sp.]